MKELLEACRELSKHLKTEKDKQEEGMRSAREPHMPASEIIERFYRTENQELRERAEKLLASAAEIEARDAAIERFRKALSEVEA